MKEERFEINPATTGVTASDGLGESWQADIWLYEVPLGQEIVLKGKDIFSCYLVGDDAYEMPPVTLVRIVIRDTANEESRPVLRDCLYQLCKAFTDVDQLMRISPPNGEVVVRQGEHIVIMVYGKDCLGLYPIHIVDDTTNTATSDDATNQAEAITLANEIKGDYNTHRADTAYHKVADTTNVVESPDASDEPSLVTLVNEIKVDYNAHRSQSGVHPYNDGGNEVTTADATDAATAVTLINEIKADYNAHLLAGEEGTGDVDASASHFALTTTRRRKGI